MTALSPTPPQGAQAVANYVIPQDDAVQRDERKTEAVQETATAIAAYSEATREASAAFVAHATKGPSDAEFVHSLLPALVQQGLRGAELVRAAREALMNYRIYFKGP